MVEYTKKTDCMVQILSQYEESIQILYLNHIELHTNSGKKQKFHSMKVKTSNFHGNSLPDYMNNFALNLNFSRKMELKLKQIHLLDFFSIFHFQG